MTPAKRSADGAGIYVHVPFCSAVCPYCDFAVVRRRGRDLDAFVATLQREIVAAGAGWSADTVYFGGGTPSALDASHLAAILTTLREVVDLDASARIFFEANPEDVTSTSVAAWRQLGVEFLSLGVQSFADRRLKLLGRRHRREQAQAAVIAAVAAGFETVSVDVIYALPGDTLGEVLADFELGAELGAQHLSGYELTIHEGTPFARWRDRGGLVEVDEVGQAELLVAVHHRLAELGFEGYEVSNFARGAAHRSAHNQKYWRHVPYLGLGPSAHSFDGRERWWNHRSLEAWSAAVDAGRAAVAGQEVIGTQERLLEALMLGLRTRDGVDLGRLGDELGSGLARQVARAVAGIGLGEHVAVEDGWLRPTLSGMALADRLAVELAGAVKAETR